MRVADVALSGKSDTECAVHEIFQRHVSAGGNGADFGKTQLARQDDLRKTDVGEKTGFFRVADVSLRAGM